MEDDYTTRNFPGRKPGRPPLSTPRHDPVPAQIVEVAASVPPMVCPHCLRGAHHRILRGADAKGEISMQCAFIAEHKWKYIPPKVRAI